MRNYLTFLIITIAVLVAAAAGPLPANAQYTVDDPGIDATLMGLGSEVSNYQFDVFVANQYTIDQITKGGATLQDLRINDENRFFYWWAGWGAWNNDGYPDVDFYDEPGYVSVVTAGAATAGWSGGGMCLTGNNSGNLSHLTDDTHVHIAWRTTNATSVGLNLFQDDNDGAVCSLSLGEAFDGAPVIGALDADWVAVDLTVATLKKFVPSFNLVAINNWTGNIFSLLTGADDGKTISVDAFYMYTVKSSGLSTVSVADQDNAASYYTLSGIRVNEPLAGQLYIKKQSNVASKMIF